MKTMALVDKKIREMAMGFSMAHKQKTSVAFIKEVLDKKDPSNLPMISSYIAVNRKELNIVVGI
jgi:hypothetical protein